MGDSKAWGDAPSGPKSWGEAATRADDPAKRTVLAPTAKGIGDGKAFLFLFGLKTRSDIDQGMLQEEIAHTQDDIAVLRGAGYTVVVDEQATKKDFLEAAYGEGDGLAGIAPTGIYYSAHGTEEGTVQTCDGSLVGPDDFDPTKVAKSLRILVLSACYVGKAARRWRKQLGGNILVVGWGRPVTIGRVRDFLDPDFATSADLDDLIARYVLADTPLPQPVEDAEVGPSALANGRARDLEKRMTTVLTMVSGTILEKTDAHFLVEVPLEGGRKQRARVTVVPAAQPFLESEQLVAVEANVGPLTEVVELRTVLASGRGPGFARVVAIANGGQTDIVVQAFVLFVRARDQDLAAAVFEVCSLADTMEARIFGSDEA